MKQDTAVKWQKIVWHFRWMLLLLLMIYNLYFFFTAFQLDKWLMVHGFLLAFYVFLGLWENYFTCISSCSIKERSME
ncbi:hypothetical protein [Bacillus sp. T3]|uniref:hypothetical protein n=1 Tax=Bacillus sp. T3 TaxID=467262 RepID=UPI002980DDAA|nr:hypothetical protein [Bacillus sp. T3]